MALYPLSNRIIYGLFTIVSLSIGIWMLVSLLIISPILYNGSLHVFLGHVVFIVRIIVPIMVITQAYCTRWKQLQIFEILSKVDATFENGFGKTIDYKTLRAKYLISFFAPVVTLAVIRIYFVYNLVVHSTDTNFRFYWFHCVQSLLVSRTRCMQVAFYANLLNDRVVWLHHELREMLQQKHLSQRTMQTKLVLLRQIYALIYDVSVLINESFGWSVLVIAISYFVDAVGNFYLICMVIQYSSTPRSTRVSAGIGFFNPALTLMVLCYSCGRCANNVSISVVVINACKSRTLHPVRMNFYLPSDL